MTQIRTCYDVAVDYMRLGVIEKRGADEHNFIIMAMLTLFNKWPEADEVPWCSAGATWFAFNGGYEYSESLLARSWIDVGIPIELRHARVGNDMVILTRGSGPQPGIEDRKAPGHVALFAGATPTHVFLAGGNQNDMITISSYPVERVLAVRRLRPI